MTITNVFAEILKSQRDENGDLIVTGKATGPDLDRDNQRCDPTWLKSAMPEWFKIGNIRENHGSNAAGVATNLTQSGDDWLIDAKIVDPVAVKKVEADVYKGFSIGIKGAHVMKSADAPGGLIMGGRIVEVSLTDRPANPTCMLELAKSAVPGMRVKGSELDRERMLVKTETVVESPVDEEVEITQADVDKALTAETVTDETVTKSDGCGCCDQCSMVEKREVSTDERKKLADKGQALPDGSFPIANVGDLKNAIRAIGRAKDPAKAKAHIKKRAKALGQSGLIPDTWKADDADLTKHDSSELAMIRQGLVNCIQAELDELCNGENEIWDVKNLLESLSMFLCWWDNEAWEGETESPNMEKTSDNVTHVTLSDTTENKAETADVTKAIEAKFEELKAEFSEKLEASQENAKRLEAELTKMKSLPVPGGPVATRTTADTVKAKFKEENLSKAEMYEQQASQVTDRQLQAGYLELARAARLAAN